jgi:hypothetical protein
MSRLPKLPEECRKCKYFDPVAEQYACSFCEIVLNRDREITSRHEREDEEDSCS